jgi:peptidoglycan/LPS O-acetylase OafA/YrhL
VNAILTAHLWLGALVCALAVLFVWQLRGRRITLYVVTLQIALGVVLMVQGLKVPWYHYGLAIVAWGGYMAANAMARREGRARPALIVTIVSSLLILIAYAIGQHAVKAMNGG